MKQQLNIPNPQAHDLGDMFAISMERRNEISKGMDDMVKLVTTGRMVYGSDVFRYIESLCETTEELIWAMGAWL